MRAHWIAGTWTPPHGGNAFRVACGADESAEYPRASAADVDAALAALERAGRTWCARSASERRAALAPALQRFVADPDPDARFAARLGWTPEEASDARDELADALHGGVREGGRGALGGVFAPCAGTVLVRRDWSELHAALAREVVALLAHGRSVLLLSDPAAPMLADALARAIAAGAADAPIAVLHDDGFETLAHALRDPRVRGLSASGPSARLRELERRLHDVHADDGDRGGFGAGVDEPPCVERSLRVLRNTSRIVRRSADPVAEARAVVAGAFGRRDALSGQAPGAIGRVLCHERSLSSFTAALLAELAANADVARPLRALDAALVEHHRRAFELGLDEGATPIFTPGDRPDAASEASGPRAVVFTNVEEHMRLAWLGRPAPLLGLARVESDARAEELAHALDQDPLAEDLSADPSPVGDEDLDARSAAQGLPAPRPMRPTPRVDPIDRASPETQP
ncbi:MAG: aldehyde dehydrogenase family protein [Planctomycetota bacterium]